MKKSIAAPFLNAFPSFVRSSRIKLMATSVSFSWSAAQFSILIRLSSIKSSCAISSRISFLLSLSKLSLSRPCERSVKTAIRILSVHVRKQSTDKQWTEFCPSARFPRGVNRRAESATQLATPSFSAVHIMRLDALVSGSLSSAQNG